MNVYRYQKDGYTLYAVRLIYGQRSPHTEQFSAFSLPPHDSTRLAYSEIESARDPSLGPGINACRRMLHFGNDRILSTNVTQGSGINTFVTYSYPSENEDGHVSAMHVGDVMFSKKEYEYFDENWNDQVQYKVHIFSKLLRALDTGDENLYPMFVADFPEISKYLLAKPNSVPQRKPLWP